MKTVPTVHVAEVTDTASFPDLPEQAMLAWADIAGAALRGTAGDERGCRDGGDADHA